MYRCLGSRRQLIYRIAHRLAEVPQLLSVHPPVEGPTDIGAEQSDLDVIRFVDYRVLAAREPGTSHRRRRERGGGIRTLVEMSMSGDFVIGRLV